MQQRSVTLVNKLRLHARAAASFVRLASAYDCEITVSCNGKTVSGKSIMGIMMLAAAKGTRIDISAAGRGEEEAASRLEELVLNRFGEDE